MNEQNPNTESAQVVGTGVPTPASPASGQPSSAGSNESGESKEFLHRLEVLERQFQSTKDRAIENYRKEFNARLDELAGKPLAVPEPVTATPTPGTANGLQAVPEALARFSETGLSVSDPDVTALIGKSHTYQTREAFLLDAERLVTRRTLKPPVSPAMAFAPPAGAPSQASPQELIGEYRKEMLAHRGKEESIKAIKARYREQGVPVDNIIFS